MWVFKMVCETQKVIFALNDMYYTKINDSTVVLIDWLYI